MPVIEWDERMAIGHPLVDQQHRELVALVNTLSDALEKGVPRSELSRLIRKFYHYTATHFQTEESLMDHETYSEYFDQVREHLDCSMTALEFHRNFLEGKDFDSQAFFGFVTGWLREHTMGLDQTLGKHLRERGLLDGRAS